MVAERLLARRWTAARSGAAGRPNPDAPGLAENTRPMIFAVG